MRLILDTGILIDFLRGDDRAVQLVLDAVDRDDELWGVVVTRTEVISGMRAEELRATFDLFSRMRWLEVEEALADHAGRLASRFVRSHPGVGAVDYLIAAGVEELDGRLVTLNVRHFPMFEGLRAAY